MTVDFDKLITGSEYKKNSASHLRKRCLIDINVRCLFKRNVCLCCILHLIYLTAEKSFKTYFKVEQKELYF